MARCTFIEHYSGKRISGLDRRGASRDYPFNDAQSKCSLVFKAFGNPVYMLLLIRKPGFLGLGAHDGFVGAVVNVVG